MNGSARADYNIMKSARGCCSGRDLLWVEAIPTGWRRHSRSAPSTSSARYLPTMKEKWQMVRSENEPTRNSRRALAIDLPFSEPIPRTSQLDHDLPTKLLHALMPYPKVLAALGSISLRHS